MKRDQLVTLLKQPNRSFVIPGTVRLPVWLASPRPSPRHLDADVFFDLARPQSFMPPGLVALQKRMHKILGAKADLTTCSGVANAGIPALQLRNPGVLMADAASIDSISGGARRLIARGQFLHSLAKLSAEKAYHALFHEPAVGDDERLAG
jgi:hypothetical protein